MSDINGRSLQRRINDFVGEIQAGHSVEDIVTHHLGVCYQKYDEQATEIERLREIVDRLPKTADGVLVVPTIDRVYGGETSITERRVFCSMLGNWNTLPIDKHAPSEDRAFPVPVSECYSTREAAEKARKVQ